MKLTNLVKPTLAVGALTVASTASWAVTKSVMTKEKEEIQSELDKEKEFNGYRKDKGKKFAIYVEEGQDEFCLWSGDLILEFPTVNDGDEVGITTDVGECDKPTKEVV
ncbi:hypothetical protein MHSWG343_10120 [Candidatus Mycoplasma haematohominis]|uniref:Uncharacterized protein n=1 Tax=Candidatus Mycoplasma haematohominis TaxID=1494318 RepID=A0A478FSF2_9MOLU|nr:hypothetical protein MHSWG343_10120 [Candidatus Mycoplasma haemohominis]